MPHPGVNPWRVSTPTPVGMTHTLGCTGAGVVQVGVQVRPQTPGGWPLEFPSRHWARCTCSRLAPECGFGQSRSPAESLDHLGSEVSDKWLYVTESVGRAARMSLWSCSTSTRTAAQIAGASRMVALREDASCSWVNIGLRLCGFSQA